VTVTLGDGGVQTFVDPASLPPAVPGDLVGTWRVDDTTTIEITVDVEGTGSLQIGTCTVDWSIADRLTTSGWPPDPTSCLTAAGGPPAGPSTSRLIESLVAGVDARVEDGQPVLVGTDSVFVLSAA
jgi:hypothetical protein